MLIKKVTILLPERQSLQSVKEDDRKTGRKIKAGKG